MKVIVLGGGVIGVTTAYFLLHDGHEVTLVERQPGVARECSHANGGFVAISQAVPWSAPGVPTKTLKTMAQPDAPILIHTSQLPRIWRWGLDFLRASRAGPFFANTQAVLRLALYSLEALKEIRAATGLDYDRVTGGALKVYSDQQSLDEAIAISERQRPLGLDFRVLDRKACLALVPALAPRIDSLVRRHPLRGRGGRRLLQVLRAPRRLVRASGAPNSVSAPRSKPSKPTAPGSPASAPTGRSSRRMPTSWRSAPTARC